MLSVPAILFPPSHYSRSQSRVEMVKRVELAGSTRKKKFDPYNPRVEAGRGGFGSRVNSFFFCFYFFLQNILIYC